jgi:DNA-binding HxlR family transcriptional regulator
MRSSPPVDGDCRAFQLAVEILARPWSALILNALQAGPLRFTEIGARARGVSDKILSARLKELEGRGLVLREVEPGPPVRVAYALTDAGRAFHEVARAIETWGRTLEATEPPAR